VGGIKGLVKLPGVAQTPAGRGNRVVALDDIYLGSFGPRCGRAALDLLNGVYSGEGLVEVDGK
jgi:iron complex transport system substrate-binding protein